MKLLGKREIDQLKTTETRQLAQEGQKLAQSVDRLRELRTEEEASLARFRTETLRHIHEEISGLEAEKEGLGTAVRNLKEERERLKKPLDHEWEKARAERAENQKEADRLKDEKRSLEGIRTDTERAVGLLQSERDRLDDDRRRTQANLARAAAARDEAERNRADSEKAREEALSFKESVEAQLVERERQLVAYEQNLSFREETLRTRDVELNDRETRLRDREQTLERNIKRNGRRSTGR